MSGPTAQFSHYVVANRSLVLILSKKPMICSVLLCYTSMRSSARLRSAGLYQQGAWCSLKTLRYSVKKLHKAAAERDELTREQRKVDILSHFTAVQLVFTDKSSKADRTSERRYGRAVAGERACEILLFKRGIQYSILPALCIDGLLTVRVARGWVDGSAIYGWAITDSEVSLQQYLHTSAR